MCSCIRDGTFHACNSIKSYMATFLVSFFTISLPDVDKSETLGSAPVFTKSFDNVTIEEGQALLLECAFDGAPRPIISWYKNGRIIPKTSSKLSFDGNLAKCSIKDVIAMDGGVYKCVANNDAGECEIEAEVKIIGEFSQSLMSFSPMGTQQYHFDISTFIWIFAFIFIAILSKMNCYSN